MTNRLGYVYDGWNGYHRSLVSAIHPLTMEQLAFRLHPEMRSVGELSWHIAHGRVEWFRRLDAPISKELWEQIGDRPLPGKADSTEIGEWLERTWKMVEATLEQWTVEDLDATFVQPYQGKVYAVSRQWTIWRIMAHDIHHGGQLSELLGAQGIFPPELTYLGGHLVVPDLVD